jgi:subtilisin family serine protease
MKASRLLHFGFILPALLFFLSIASHAGAAAAAPLPAKAPVLMKPAVTNKINPANSQQSGTSAPLAVQTPLLKAPALIIKCPEIKYTSPEVLPPAWAGRDYSYRLMGSGGHGTLAFSLEEKDFLPPGLRLMANGTLLGRPSKAGEFVLLITLQDNCPAGMQQVRKKFSLKVNPEVRPFVTGQNNPTTKTLGQPNPTNKVLTQPDPSNRVLAQPDPTSRSLVLTTPEPKLQTTDLKVQAPSGVTPPAAALPPPEGQNNNSQAPHIKGQIVVTMQMDKGAYLIKLLQAKYKLALLESFTIKALKQMVATFSTDQDLAVLIGEIRKENGVILTQNNRIYGTFAEPKGDLQNLCGILNFAALHKYHRGKRITVALIDTGVDLSHEDLKKRIIYSQNFIKDSPYRAELHGTAVAGIIAASINNFGIEGIAPEADLLALRACEQVSENESIGKGYTTSIIQALDVAIEKKARVVNMSFGSPASDPIIASLLMEGARQGILFVAPVGNLTGQEYPAFPASCPAVIAVGGLDQNGNPYPDDHLVSFAKVNAPAENIFTTTPGNKHNFMSGSSLSSAIVAGILALGVEANPRLCLETLPANNHDLCAWMQALLGMKTICLK